VTLVTVARKPLSEGAVAANVLKHGTGALSINACRITHGSEDTQGRWPANLILAHKPGCLKVGGKVWACEPDCPVAHLDHTSGSVGAGAPVRGTEKSQPVSGDASIYGERERVPGAFYGDAGGASRFFKQVGGRKG
jgi:site-specific DNA-methyltransferase (adenine-specific)